VTTAKTRRVAALASVAAIGVAGLALAGPAPQARASGLDIRQVWSVALPDAGAPDLGSSPAVADLAGGPAVVFGDLAGRVYALHLADGSPVTGWPASTFDGGPVDGAVSVLGSTVYVPVGDYATPTTGGYQAIAANPFDDWHQTVPQLPGGPGAFAVIAGLTVGTLQGQPAVFAGSLGQLAGGYNAVTGAPLAGFPFFQADSDQATAAVADLYDNDQPELVYGGASTAGVAYGRTYPNGGHVRVLNQTGGLVCDYLTQQPVSSSPAVGTVLAGGAVGIVASTVSGYNQPGSNLLMGFNSRCGLVWQTSLGGGTLDASPALVDALGNGTLQVAETAHNTGLTSGATYLVNGATGQIIWSTPTLGAALTGPVSVDLGAGHQDLVVTGTGGVQILDGVTGQVLWQAATQNGVVPAMQDSALVTDDPDGAIGITIVGYEISPFQTQVVHYEVAGSNGGVVDEPGAWPEFHHDPQLTGDAGTPAPQLEVPCAAPAHPVGYDLAGADGSVYPLGNLPFCGSALPLPLAQPISGVAPTPDGGGYWLVARDGGVFSFGDARFFGSAAIYRPAAPIVGMAVTPDGGGYWLVGADGGVFSFGDARFFGSAVPYRPAAPIVGMAADPAGGYWLVGADGGVFSFAAPFFGSAVPYRPAAPTVGIMAAPGGAGYWMVGADGGIFTFGAIGFYGSQAGATDGSPVVAGGAR
jgi:hypothetical protein